MIIYHIRKMYAKLTQICNEHEKEMREWAKTDPETYAYHMHYCPFTQEVT